MSLWKAARSLSAGLLGSTLALACGAPPPRAAVAQPDVERVTFVLESASVRETVAILSGVTNRPVVIGSRAEPISDCTTLSVSAPGPVTRAEAVQLTRMALSDGPIRLEEQGGALLVMVPAEHEALCPAGSPGLGAAMRAMAAMIEAEPLEAREADEADEAPEAFDSFDFDPSPHVRVVQQTERHSEVEFTRSVFEQHGTRMARLIPTENEAGEPCVRMYGIRRNGLSGRTGMRNGDCVLTVNGRPLASPAAALAIVEELDRTDEFNLVFDRDGERHTLLLRLVETPPGQSDTRP